MIVHDHGRAVDTPAPPVPAVSGPNWLPVIPDAIPRELADTVAWYPAIIRPKATKVGSWDKIPGDPKTGQPAKWAARATRQTFGTAFMAYESGRFPAIGYMMDATAGRVGIDLDHCVSKDGTVAPWALDIVASFEGAYWERSISGTGLRGFCRGTLPVGGCRSKIEGCSVELYADQRFLVVTGQALHRVEQLPELQPAVDALHARLTAGRTRATGTAITSGLTGRNTAPAPEAYQLVEAIMSGRHGAQMLSIWSRDDLHVAGASEEDWALATEAAYQAISRGYSGDELHQMVESVMRAGPYREKWDDPRGAVSWLAQTVANAVATVQKRVGSHPPAQLHQPATVDPEEPPIPEETLEQKVARLERELGESRGIIAVQRSAIQSARADLQEKTAYISLVTEVLAKPNDEMSSTGKLVFLALAWETHYRADRGRTRLPMSALAQRTGMSKNTVSRESRSICDRPGSPFERRVTRELIHDEDGIPQWMTTVEIAPRTERTEDTMRAGITLPADPNRRKHGGSDQATARRQERREWGQCSKHDNRTVTVRGLCPDCGEVVGERQVTRQEFDGLNHHLGDSDSAGTPTVYVSSLNTNQDGDSAADLELLPRYGQVSEPLAPPSGWPDYEPGFDAPPEPLRPASISQRVRSSSLVWRCVCGSTERRIGNGWYVCLKCADRRQVEPLAAVAGGED